MLGSEPLGGGALGPRLSPRLHRIPSGTGQRESCHRGLPPRAHRQGTRTGAPPSPGIPHSREQCWGVLPQGHGLRPPAVNFRTFLCRAEQKDGSQRGCCGVTSRPPGAVPLRRSEFGFSGNPPRSPAPAVGPQGWGVGGAGFLQRAPGQPWARPRRPPALQTEGL